MEMIANEINTSRQLMNQAGSFSETSTRTRVELIQGGRKYFDLLKRMISEGKETIHLQTYIYDDDETGREIADALISAAKRGVSVFVLADGFASQSLSSSFIEHLRNGGVNFRFFEPVFRSKYFYFGRRLHHKMIVVDGKCAVVGGINISNRYNDMNGEPAWLDFALYVEGIVAKDLCILAFKTWKGFPRSMAPTPCETKTTGAVVDHGVKDFVKMRRNDWVRGKSQISASYIALLKNAKKEITILCSYFLPGPEIRYQLALAAERGVKVRLIVAGTSDVKIAKQAERFIYTDLLKHNIEIYEYQKTVLHGKLAVCDNQWLTLGSYNVNRISAYASIELNLDVYDPVLASQTTKVLDRIIREDCVLITWQWMKKKANIFRKFTQWASYELIRILFFMFTFYFKQRE